MQPIIKTRTLVQIRTHAQKVRHLPGIFFKYCDANDRTRQNLLMRRWFTSSTPFLTPLQKFSPFNKTTAFLRNILSLQVFKKVGLRKIGPGTVTQAEAAAAAAEYGLGFDPSASPLSLGQVFHFIPSLLSFLSLYRNWFDTYSKKVLRIDINTLLQKRFFHL